ncbi:MAG TPA: CHAT domain-containing protein, partial [Myxococcaceae bacterium]|nr:CHAT domain-containing protein [Myxococcaceae bacterium]
MRTLGIALLATAVSSTTVRAESLRTLDQCRALVREQPRSLDGYECLLAHRFARSAEVLGFLEARLRSAPADPRPRLYRAVVHHYAGDRYDLQDYVRAAEAFGREHDVRGEVHALTAHVSALCVNPNSCDEQAHALLRRAGELAVASGQVALLQRCELWRMKLALVAGNLVAAEESSERLRALGEPADDFLKLEGLQLRTYLATKFLDYGQARELSRHMLASLGAGDPRRAQALGGIAASTAHLALQGVESRETAERIVREALREQERVGLALWYPENGYLPSRLQLALLLGPGPEAFELVRSALAGYTARAGWTNPAWARLALGELLATADPPDLEEALRLSNLAIDGYDESDLEDAGRVAGLVLRSRVQFRLGHFSEGKRDGLDAVERADHMRGLQSEIPMRQRYAESLSFVYRSFAGDLVAHHAPGDMSALDDGFQVMERLRARGLMESLLAEVRSGQVEQTRREVRPPRVAEVQAALSPREALLSFEVWRPEPTMEAPFREGSSWLTVVTRGRVEVVALPNADVLEPQVRAWTGLLERRDGSDRGPGARLYAELLRPALDRLPAEIDRLVVIPDGPLHRLPFDGLSGGPGEPYLAETFGVSLVPSAALWLRFRGAPRLPPGRILVLADPSDPSARRSVRRDGLVGALVHARQEAEVAFSAFPAGGELRTGLPASESFLKSADLRGVSLLHLATHAVTDARDPERAAVMLAPGSPSEDGRLEPREIGRLDLTGKTVVLAGCETSAGTVRRGEGVMSLARAFFSAGAASVVGTLNRARDDEAAAFF